MPSKFQDIVDPIACVDQRRHYTGSVDLTKLERIRDLINKPIGDLSVDINFDREGRFAMVKVRIRAKLVLQCNTCLKPLDWHTDHFVTLAIVKSLDEFEIIPEDCEPWLIEDSRVSLSEMIEDELLLQLPQIPRHEVCSMTLPPQDAGFKQQSVAAPEEKTNPFEALKALKQTDSAGDH